MANVQSAKGNPASKRMGNANLKARRAASWRRGEARKLAARVEQAKREKANAELVRELLAEHTWLRWPTDDGGRQVKPSRALRTLRRAVARAEASAQAA